MDVTRSPTPAVYLDHAATTPARPQARDAWAAVVDGDHRLGNPSSVHRAGQRARAIVEEARETIADLLGVSPHEVVFTAGGTEADNLAVKGLFWGAGADRRHVVTTAVEHPAVLAPARWLARSQGAEVTIVPPRGDGTVDPGRVLAAVRPDTAVVSVMAANNELGAVNDLPALSAALRARGVPLHTDAVQAFATRPPSSWAADAASLSAHKFGGPVGTGVAVLRRDLAVEPVLHGGDQERVRSGTLAAALAAACAAAVAAADADREALADRATALSDRLASGLTSIDGVRRNGPAERDRRLPTHVHVSIDGVDGEALVFGLDRAGVAASAGAACGSGAQKASHVLAACGIEADAAVRFSVGWTTTERDVDAALDRVTTVVRRLRRRDVAGGGVARRTAAGLAAGP